MMYSRIFYLLTALLCSAGIYMAAIDNLLTNIEKVTHTSVFNAEKVVRVIEGTYIQGTDTDTVAYDLGNQQVFKVAHGFDRPLFPDLYWSLDGAYFQSGGGSFINNTSYAIAFSDSTYIYIMAIGVANGTPVYYKVACSWITDYDGTDPFVPEFNEYPDYFRRTFDSDFTTLMIVTEGSMEFSTTSGTLTNVTQTISHGLPYTPFAKVYIESIAGQVWPLNYGGAANPYLVQSDQVEGVYFSNPSQFIIDLDMKSSNGVRKAWYFLYTPVRLTGTVVGAPSDFPI
jgi:hypothetical protein